MPRRCLRFTPGAAGDVSHTCAEAAAVTGSRAGGGADPSGGGGRRFLLLPPAWDSPRAGRPPPAPARRLLRRPRKCPFSRSVTRGAVAARLRPPRRPPPAAATTPPDTPRRPLLHRTPRPPPARFPLSSLFSGARSALLGSAKLRRGGGGAGSSGVPLPAVRLGLLRSGRAVTAAGGGRARLTCPARARGTCRTRPGRRLPCGPVPARAGRGQRTRCAAALSSGSRSAAAALTCQRLCPGRAAAGLGIAGPGCRPHLEMLVENSAVSRALGDDSGFFRGSSRQSFRAGSWEAVGLRLTTSHLKLTRSIPAAKDERSFGAQFV